MKNVRLNRRQFLKGSTAGLVGASALGAGVISPRTAQAHPYHSKGIPPKSIIFLVSDGMSTGVVSLTEQLALRTRNQSTHFHDLLNDPLTTRGFFETYSLNSMVTDSAAAATAWGSGSRVFNGAINRLPDGTELKPIGNLVKESGRSMGLVTTATVTHATPAGFASVVTNRSSEDEIAPQYLDVVDIILGGGLPFFDGAKRSDKRDVIAEYKAAGYTFATTRDELLAAKGKAKVLGLFSDSHVPYTLDHMNSEELTKKVPTLAEMTKVALEALDKNPEGFLLQVEGARIDHAAHANDAAAILWDQLAFDDAVGVALEYAKSREDVLVVVSSDHGNANPGLNGMGRAYFDSTKCFELITESKMSFSEVQKLLEGIVKDNATISDEVLAKQIIELTETTQGIVLTDAEAGAVGKFLKTKELGDIFAQHRSLAGLYNRALGNHHGIGWCGTTHTDDYTIVAAHGYGQEQFEGVLKNVDFFSIVTYLFGIQYVNPSMEYDEAKNFLAFAPSSDITHWA